MAVLIEIRKKWNSFGILLYVPEEIRDGIMTNHSTDSDQLRAVLLYMLSFHPFASWRVIINTLLMMDGHYLAASIKEYAEPVTGTHYSYNISNLALIGHY